MTAWSTLPTFYPSAGQVLSAADLNQLREAARLIDAWSYRIDPAFDSSSGLDTGAPGYENTTTPVRIWWGAVLFRTGCTTLTVEARGALTGSESLKVYIGGGDTTLSGTLLGTITIPGSLADFSGSFAISGYTDGDIIPVEIVVQGAHLSTAIYIINDVYLSTVSKSGWVAAPSFASVADATDATKLNQLTFSLQWMYERIRMIPIPARQMLMYNLGPFKATTDPQHLNRPMYHGSVGKYYSNASLRIKMWVVSTTTVGWKFDVLLNGVNAYSSPTYGIGGQPIDVPISLASYTLGTRVRIAILASTVTPGTAFPLRFTRWSNGVMHAVAGTAWPYAALPAAFDTPNTLTNANTLRAALASLATIVNDAKTRIDGRPELWARSRAVRRHSTKNGSTEQILQARSRHGFWQRAGSELIVKGSDIKIAYGPVSVEVDADSNGWENYTYLKNEAIDAEDGISFYLDDLEALDYGMAYRVLGNPIYAAEQVG